MNNNFIDFKKKRELGDILTDTFAFLRQNGKQLLGILVKTCGIAFIVFLAAYAFFIFSMGDLSKALSFGSFDNDNIGSLAIAIFIFIVSGIILYGIFFGSILNFINEYITNEGVVNEENVKTGTKKDFGALIGLGFLSGIIVMLGSLFCLLPGIYLYVPMTLVFSIMVFGKKTVVDSISESFTLVSGEWWMTFITLFIIALIVGVIGFVFSIPSVIYQYSKLLTSGQMESMTAIYGDWVYILLNTLANAAQFITYIITAVATAFIYFDLNEKKNLTGTFEKIDSLGKPE